MPNNNPNATNRSTLERKIAIASKKSVTHHGFFIGATNDNIADLQSVEGMDGVCGIKIFMGSSTGICSFMSKRNWRISSPTQGGYRDPCGR